MAFTRRWDGHFLNVALMQAYMSKDPSTQVGAIIVGPDLEIRSTGFNGFPRGIKDDGRLTDRDLKLKLMVHAEMNAVLNAARIGVSVKGCTLYFVATDETRAEWGGPPCTRCTVELIQAGILTVVSLPGKLVTKWHDDLKLSRQLLLEAGINHREICAGT